MHVVTQFGDQEEPLSDEQMLGQRLGEIAVTATSHIRSLKWNRFEERSQIIARCHLECCGTMDRKLASRDEGERRPVYLI